MDLDIVNSVIRDRFVDFDITVEIEGESAFLEAKHKQTGELKTASFSWEENLFKNLVKYHGSTEETYLIDMLGSKLSNTL